MAKRHTPDHDATFSQFDVIASLGSVEELLHENVFRTKP